MSNINTKLNYYSKSFGDQTANGVLGVAADYEFTGRIIVNQTTASIAMTSPVPPNIQAGETPYYKFVNRGTASISMNGIAIGPNSECEQCFELGAWRPVYSTQLNTAANPLVQVVNVNTPVTIDNLKVQVSSAGNGFNISTVTGAATFYVEATLIYAAGNFYYSHNQAFAATTTMANPFAWNSIAPYNTIFMDIRDITNNKYYEIKISIGAA